MGPVTLVCGPAGSGKTMLVSSWLQTAELPGAVAWVGVERDELDATRFWGMVADALRETGAIAPGDPLATLTPAPDGHEEFVGGLLDGLGRLWSTVFLVLDDLHRLRSEEALRGLEQLLARAPEQLRTIVVSRGEPRLGLHRARLDGGLIEIRAEDLEFTPEEARELLTTAGVSMEPYDLGRLYARTEGWAAGLRLAALSLARHESPERFVAEFSGSERTVADYLVGEVLAGQAPEVRRLLLRTCVLERVNGPLADLLTGRRDGTRLLHELADANALVTPADVARTWFRYHPLLRDVLRLELHREAPEEVADLHRLAAAWHADHGSPVEAIRHARRVADGELATELLGRHWIHLVLDGEEATLGTLLDDLPAPDDAELAAIAAADRLAKSRWDEADALLDLAQRTIDDVPPARRARAETALATVRLLRARRLGDVGAVVDGAAAALEGGTDPAGAELTAFALMNLGIAESWVLRLADAEAHLERGLALGAQVGRPYVEVGCLGGLGVAALMTNRLDLAEERFRRAIAIAERVGWSASPIAGAAYAPLGAVLVDRGRLAEGERWLERAEPALKDSPEPAARVGLRHGQGMLALARGRYGAALEAFGAGERLAGELRAPHFLGVIERQWRLRAALRLGEAPPGDRDGGDTAEWRNLAAHARLATGDAEGAAAAVAPVLDGTAPPFHVNFAIEALLLDARARALLGDDAAAEASIERALDRAEPDGRVWIFLTVPGTRELLEAHPRHRTAHAGHLTALLDHLAGTEPARAEPAPPVEPLSERELGVLRFLPTNLSAGEIAGELYLSVHTVKTHMRKLYAKLDVHTRADAVQRGRALGLLAPGAHTFTRIV